MHSTAVWGVDIVLQTFGRSGHWNPHLHIMASAGGINPEGKWKAVNFIPHEMMRIKSPGCAGAHLIVLHEFY